MNGFSGKMETISIILEILSRILIIMSIRSGLRVRLCRRTRVPSRKFYFWGFLCFLGTRRSMSTMMRSRIMGWTCISRRRGSTRPRSDESPWPAAESHTNMNFISKLTIISTVNLKFYPQQHFWPPKSNF